jgi:hypothetical protein
MTEPTNTTNTTQSNFNDNRTVDQLSEVELSHTRLSLRELTERRQRTELAEPKLAFARSILEQAIYTHSRLLEADALDVFADLGEIVRWGFQDENIANTDQDTIENDVFVEAIKLTASPQFILELDMDRERRRLVEEVEAHKRRQFAPAGSPGSI